MADCAHSLIRSLALTRLAACSDPWPRIVPRFLCFGHHTAAVCGCGGWCEGLQSLQQRADGREHACGWLCHHRRPLVRRLWQLVQLYTLWLPRNLRWRCNKVLSFVNPPLVLHIIT